MSIMENITLVLQCYKSEHHISTAVMAEQLEIAESSLQCYLKGTANPRASTIELLADKLNLPVAELVSTTVPRWEHSEALIRATREFGSLTEEKQEKVISLFRELAAVLYGDC